jgi:hypothetical protein
MTKRETNLSTTRLRHPIVWRPMTKAVADEERDQPRSVATALLVCNNGNQQRRNEQKTKQAKEHGSRTLIVEV